MLNSNLCKFWNKLCKDWPSKSANALAQMVSSNSVIQNVAFDEFRNNQQVQLERFALTIDKKSNLKDVCALLDLKSSKLVLFNSHLVVDIDDVNKALA